MADTSYTENDYIIRSTEIIEKNISNDQFGVSELANEIGRSRSNLLRKVQRHTKLSVSKFIMQVRLHRTMEILKQNSSNVSEVSFEVGFSSTSYFVKYFRDYYGFPPGETVNRKMAEEGVLADQPSKLNKGRLFRFIARIVFVIIVAIVFLKPINNKVARNPNKSIMTENLEPSLVDKFTSTKGDTYVVATYFRHN